MEEDKTFKLKKVDDGQDKVEVNGQSTISPFNSAKHLKYAKLPAHCNDCVYRSIEDGGNGKCPKYEKDAVCGIRKDIQKLTSNLDTRNAESIKVMLDIMAKKGFENVMMALYQMSMDGNVPDRNTRNEVDQLLKIVNTINELNSKISVTATQKEISNSDNIMEIFKSITVKKDG